MEIWVLKLKYISFLSLSTVLRQWLSEIIAVFYVLSDRAELFSARGQRTQTIRVIIVSAGILNAKKTNCTSHYIRLWDSPDKSSIYWKYIVNLSLCSFHKYDSENLRYLFGLKIKITIVQL